jgi:hypothetical protein
MAISTLDGFIGATKQQLCISKVVSRGATAWGSVFDMGGNPGAGTLAAANSANGVVPTSATAGFPTLAAFGGSATGYLAQVSFGSSSQATRFKLFDMLFKAGTYAYNSGTTNLTSQPSYSARCDSNYSGTQIWIECTTATSGSPTFTIGYTNGAGTSGRSTGAVSLSTLTAGSMVLAPLQAGDSSVSKIDSIVTASGAAGVFNVLVLRPLWAGGVPVTNQRAVHNIASTNMPVIYPSTAFYLAVVGASAITGFPDVDLTVVNG